MYVDQGNETLRTNNKSKRTSVTIYHDVDVKSETRDPERLTPYNKNIAIACPDVCKVRGKYESNGAPNTSSDRAISTPSEERIFERGNAGNVWRPQQPIRRQ